MKKLRLRKIKWTRILELNSSRAGIGNLGLLSSHPAFFTFPKNFLYDRDHERFNSGEHMRKSHIVLAYHPSVFGK